MSEPTIRWRFVPPNLDGSGAAVTSEADVTVHNGVVYFGSKDNHMYALDAATGEVIWSYNTFSNVTSGGTLSEDGSVIYFGTESSGFYALDADDGDKRWNYTRNGNDGNFYAKPTVYEDEGEFIVMAAADGRVYAFNALIGGEREGRLLWAQPDVDRDENEGRFREAGIAYRGVLYIGNDDGNLYAYRTIDGGVDGDGRLRKSQMVYAQAKPDSDPEGLRTEIVRNGSNIYFGNNAGEVYQYDRNRITWVYQASKDVRGQIAAYDDIVVFADRGGTIIAVNPDPSEAVRKDNDQYKTPARLWIESTDNDARVVGGPVISGNYVYAIDVYGTLYVIYIPTGEAIFKLDLWSGNDPCVSCSSAPAIEGNMLFAGTQQGALVAVQLPED